MGREALGEARVTPEQQRVLAYLKIEPATPTSLLAQKCSVSKETIEKWKKEPEFQEQLNRPRKELLKDVAFLSAMEGNIPAMEKYMKLFEDETAIDDFALALGLTTDDLDRIARHAYEYEKARRAA